jgi:hypothetical protein
METLDLLTDRLIDNELLISFEYEKLKVSLYYLGGEKVGYKIEIEGKLIEYGDDYRPSPLHNQDDTEAMVAFLGFLMHAESFPNAIIRAWAEENEDNVNVMLSDFEQADDEEFLTVNQMTYEEATSINQYIKREP